MAHPPKAPRERRAFSTLAGAKVDAGGEPGAAALLRRAFAAGAEPESAHALTHAFHAYPARMHPQVARALVRGFAGRGATVLDPFCGSGTVLVEARAAGCRAIASDVSPLAVRLSATKGGLLSAGEAKRLPALAVEIAARAAETGAPARAPARRGAPQFDPHVLRELAGLRAAIDAVRERPQREALELCLSAIVVKVSRRAADTSAEPVVRRLARGFASRLFVDRAHQLATGLAALAAEAPAGTPPPAVTLADARKLTHVPSASVDLVVTSPPYLGTYDYVDQVRLRLDWLDLDPRSAIAREIGSRSQGVGLGAQAGFERDLAAAIGEMRRVLRPTGALILEIGDSMPAPGRILAARPVVERLAGAARLRVTAWADARRRPPGRRPGARARREGPVEHLLLLRPAW